MLGSRSIIANLGVSDIDYQKPIAKILAKAESLDEPVDNTDSNSLDDDIRDDDEWATKDDADISPFQHPWKEQMSFRQNSSSMETPRSKS